MLPTQAKAEEDIAKIAKSVASDLGLQLEKQLKVGACCLVWPAFDLAPVSACVGHYASALSSHIARLTALHCTASTLPGFRLA